MSGTARHKVVTSGRLTGKVKATRAAPDPGPPPWPQPDYSLYSTDSEDQVTSIHKGLDQCAALLSGILQADHAASTGLQRTPKRVTSSTFQGKKTLKKLPSKTGLSRTMKSAKGGTAKPRASTSQGKMASKKPPTKTGDFQNPQNSERHQPGSVAAAMAAHKFCPPAAHSGVMLHPPQKSTQPLQSPSAGLQSQQLATSSPPAGGSEPAPLRHQNYCRSASGASHTSCGAAREAEDGFVAGRDADRVNGCSLKESGVEPGQGRCSGGTRAEALQDLLQELRALIAGQGAWRSDWHHRGSAAERLLSRLEQTVGGSDVGPAALHHYPQFCSCVKNQQEQKQEVLHGSEEPNLQEELVTAQSRLQELQDDLSGLRKALQDTQSHLRDTEAEKALMKTELEAARSRLLQSEREQSKLASVAQHRLEEIEKLRRLLQRRPSDHQDVQESSSLTQQYSGKQDPVVASAERIREYLLSLDQVDQVDQVEPTGTETVRVAAERDQNPSELKEDGSSRRPIRPEPGDGAAETLPRPSRPSSEDVLPRGRQLLDSTAHCDVESVWSSWSMKSESTFNTRDEAAFRDGLAALDASIASLQKTIQLERNK
ncbi:uncharacterized protein ccdc14 isoform X2 [Fundulus heteroclitus]|uniref:uncharacterized protein ccdc14 isoform X2 n=1 Tax=Fundulus heteroclitus TaxID=8078 RepID=UPI00165B32C7|nr:uncharacterized protein ccdc14 isoform X2 [Fundulus heteroclitus]